MELILFFLMILASTNSLFLHAVQHDLEMQDKKKLNDSVSLIPQKNSFRSTCLKQEINPKTVACVGTASMCLCVAGSLSVIMYAVGQNPCIVDLAEYPVCGKSTAYGVDQLQSVRANYYGNYFEAEVYASNLSKLVKNYCEKPVRTICTGLDSNAYPKLPRKCRSIKNGKLLGAAVSQEVCPDSTIALRLEEEFNRANVSYCKVNPATVGFDVRKLYPILLTLYLVDKNVTSIYVKKDRWDNPYGMHSEKWGAQKNCDADWSKNSDPAAKKKRQLKQQKQRNSVKRLARSNTTKKRAKFSKNKKYKH